MKKTNQKIWPFRAMTFSAPDGSRIIKPKLETLESIIFQQHSGYWMRGCGESSLSVLEHLGKGTTAVLLEEPLLMFYLKEPFGFLLLHFQPEAQKPPTQYVPFMSSKDSRWVKHTLCGDSFYAPLACFVTREIAWEIVKHFLQTKGRSEVAAWADRLTLDFRTPATGDVAPALNDLA